MQILDFEVTCGAETPPGETIFPAYALYYVCEDVKGACLFKRQNVEIVLRVRNNPAETMKNGPQEAG